MGKRAKVVAEIERGLARLADQPGLCLFYAHQAASVLWKHRYRVVIQAGSLQWPRVRREEDDGRMNTHFAYMWTPGAYDSALSVAMGNLPEMHVWARHPGQPGDCGLHYPAPAGGGRGPGHGLERGRPAAVSLVLGSRVARLGSLPARS